ncbi:transcriptional regulator family: Zinc finger CCHC-type [Penicillium psychrosexuale]|uniref:transcriptional regulator family: Zinc finger CCHC-type n=1 Tax=Penicillium psychrosexuale TaxID=1002107 RepID=UPI0025457891|nr:transcriptional regulator family: Zinc finger CCHC-type [Penicillium psychrosexuale]KAJ5781731.1 transcriptional regulator family: Zinc finger CCHC-type [Penicillium psychrosexuale]
METNIHENRDDDFTCGQCGGSGHMTRQCPNDSLPLRQRDSNAGDAYGNYGDDNGGGHGDYSGGGGDRACYNCGQEGHSKADCTEPRKMGACFNCGQDGHSKAECTEPRKMGACFNCGEEGHSKSECPRPRVFRGTCRICEKEGHPAVDCPERPPDVCKNCQAQGHKTMECKENRKFDLNLVADMLPQEGWAAMKKASDERDLDDFREALKIYSKAVPNATWADIEKKMREDNFNIYIIAMETEVDDVMSLIDLQGVLDREYVIGFFFNPKASRGHLRDRWPADAEENLERMKSAGIPYERKVPKCLNCGELGHISRSCKEERAEGNDRVEIKCSNCEGAGHRVRDCRQQRKHKHGCRNCGSIEHIASDCTEPRSAAGVECRRCNETGHFAKDCPTVADRGPRTCRNCGSEDHIARDCDQPRDVSTVTCRNCEKTGHYSRDCDQPKDWSKVQCKNCGEMGHTVVRCRQPPKEEEPQDEPTFSPGSPKREEPDLLDSEATDQQFEYKRHDDEDLW